MGFDPNC
jgi:SpoVK/Ycf46/Vps4 family AAA+-type ATPase